jgi:hypothetical protein
MHLSIPEQIRLLHVERFNSGEEMDDNFVLAIENAIRTGRMQVFINEDNKFVVRLVE